MAGSPTADVVESCADSKAEGVWDVDGVGIADGTALSGPGRWTPGKDVGICSITERPLAVESIARVRQVTINIPLPIAVTLVMTVLAVPPNKD